jgi:hypothetical protein
MIPKPISDMEINRNVRKVFVRHNINLGWISISSCRGYVMVNGNLVLLPGAPGDLDPSLVGTMFGDIRRVDGVQRVTTELDNWEHDDAMDVWKMKKSFLGTKLKNIANHTPFDLSKER